MSSDPKGGHTTGQLVPRRCTLDGFATEVAESDGIDIRHIQPRTTVLVRTENSLYRLIPLRPGDCHVLVDGGQFFPEPIEARLVGSTFGGSFLKMAWIGIGMHLEIHGDGDTVTTSRVCRITTERNGSSVAAVQ